MSEVTSEIPTQESNDTEIIKNETAEVDTISSKRHRDVIEEEVDEIELSKKTKSDIAQAGAVENVVVKVEKTAEVKPVEKVLATPVAAAVAVSTPAPAPAAAQPVQATVTSNPTSSGTTHSNPNTTIVSTLSPTGDTLVIEVSQEKVGQIIGSKGAIIQDMQTRTGAKIYVNQNFPDGVNRQVNISGNPFQIQQAGDLVRRIILEGPTAIHVNSLAGGPSMQITIDCPQAIVGRVIGSAGATIKELQTRSGAKIQINQDFPEGVPRKILIIGTQTAVSLATQLVSFVMENGPAMPGSQSSFPGGAGGYGASPFGGGMSNPYGPPTVTMGPGGTQTQTMECSKPMVGRIIGRKGETVTMLQLKSGCKIQIEQSTNPCKIMMTGPPHSVAVAIQLINELIATGNMGNGVIPQMGGPMGGGMGGGMMGMGMPQMGMGGGGNPYAAAAMHSQHGMQQHGMPQPFGGYPGQQPQGMAGGGGGVGGYPGMMPPQQQQLPQQQQPQPQSFGGPQYGVGGPGGAAAGGPGRNPQQQQQQQPQQYQMPQQYGQPYQGGVGGGIPSAAAGGGMGGYGQQQQQQQQPQYGGAVAPAPVKALPSPWSEHKTDDGNVYWYNSTTGISQWERPV